jgi:K+/H+ antiporter YhaU regulatory subunit KhtT
MEQLGKRFESINKSDTDQTTKEAYEHIYTSVSGKYLSHMKRARRLHATTCDPSTIPDSS